MRLRQVSRGQAESVARGRHSGWSAFGGGALWATTDTGSITRHDLETGAEQSIPTGSNWFYPLGFDRDGSILLETSSGPPSDNPNAMHITRYQANIAGS